MALFEFGQLCIKHLGVVPALRFGADDTLQPGDGSTNGSRLALYASITANVLDAVPCLLDGIFDVDPPGFQVTHVGQHFGGAGQQRIGKGFLGQGSRISGAPLLFKGFDLLVGGAGEVAHRLVELDGGRQRRFAQLGKALHSLFRSLPPCTLKLDGGLGSQLQARSRDLPGGRQLVEHGSGIALRARHAVERLGHEHEPPSRHPGLVAGGDECVGECLGFLRPLIRSHSQRSPRRCCCGKRVDHAHDVPAQRTGGGADTAEHVFELAALLQQYGHGCLPALQRHHNVGELGGHPAQCCCSLLR